MSRESSVASAPWHELWPDDKNRRLECALPAFLLRQRWFGGKARVIDRVLVRDAAILSDLDALILVIDVQYVEGDADAYFVPLNRLPAEPARARFAEFPHTHLAMAADGSGGIFDATVDPELCRWLLQLVGQEGHLPLGAGTLIGRPSRGFTRQLGKGTQALSVRRGTSEQSNTSVSFGDSIILKLFRRIRPGPNPDCEVTSYLTIERGNVHVPSFLGSLHYIPNAGEELTLGMLQTLVANQGDGWSWTLAALERYYESCAGRGFPSAWQALLEEPLLSLRRDDLPGSMVEANAGYLHAITTLARRTAELHVDLAADSALPAFRTRLMRKDELGAMARLMKESVLRTLEQLEERRGQLPEDVAARAAAVLACREQLTARFGEIEYLDAAVKLARVHGDYHLGQVLRTTDDFVILDFEGEPARPLAERRAPQSPLKDVAGMLRSFSYAANAALGDFRLAHPESRLSKRWASLWETGVATVFLESYRAAVAGTRLIPEREDDIARLLGAFLLDKAVYELGYELNNRQAWINIPLEAVAGWCREPRAFERPRWKEMSSV